MKINKIAIILTSVIAMSCTGDFEDMNKDPMAVSEVSPKLILPVMMNSGYHLVAGDYQRATTLYSALYCQCFAGSEFIPSAGFDEWVIPCIGHRYGDSGVIFIGSDE
jgi:hypothetical protein